MRDIFTVMSFTIKDMLKRKSFIISTLIILILIVVGFNIPNLISSFESDSKESILIVDKDNVFEGALKNLDLGYEIKISNEDYEEIKDKINNDEIEDAIIVEKQDNIINISYLVQNISLTSEIPNDLIDSLREVYKNIQLNKLNLTEEELKTIDPIFNVDLKQVSDKEVSGNIFAIMILSIFLFYAIYFCAYQVSSSITTEKTSKIIETLVTSTSPKNIVLGKTLGIGSVGLMQLIAVILTTIISAKLFLTKEILDLVLDMSTITIYLGIIVFIYFILGYFIYAFLYALTGSTANKPEDVQSVNTPVALLAVASFYLSYFTMMNPTSSLNTFASLFPLSSPFCMPFRYMMGLANMTDVLLSLLILVVSILIIAKCAIKIYSNAILNYGSKLSLKDMINMFKDNNK